LLLFFTVLTIGLFGCTRTQWNNPYPPGEAKKNILYQRFDSRPKHLDPIQSYSSNEYVFIGQIYEPPLEYHYLKRPYQLQPSTAASLPRTTHLDAQQRPLPADADPKDIAYTIYEIHIKPGIMYQPHPAFAKDDAGKFLYHHLSARDLEGVNTLSDFKHTGSRELTAADYVYQIKRMAHPRLHSPIFGVMSEYIVGLKQYAKTLKKAYQQARKTQSPPVYLNLNDYPLEGVTVVDRYTYRIKVKGTYPQLRYWLAMPFFAPMPDEAIRFYTQPGMKERNLTLDWYPVGTGPYMLTENNPNRRMVLSRNPNYHPDFYPSEGSEEARDAGLLHDAGKRLPLINKVVFSLEKESIPYWNKFLQGYYDLSSIVSDSFDQAIQFSAQGEAELTPQMKEKGIQLITAVQPSTYYMGFNMLDGTVGGYGERQRKLRQAIAIAVDYEEYIAIFANGRGIAAQGPIPPGIFGYETGKEGMDQYVYNWVNGKPQRKPISDAKRLLAEAGYPKGRDRKTGKPLIVHLDITAGGPEDKAMLDWLRKQFKKIDLQLDIRTTDYNRFQDKMLNGNAQLFMWGWNADYPDPENFMFLLYGPNGKVKHQGENAANYNNPEFNRLFEQMKTMKNSPARRALIRKMVTIVQRDAPWLFGWHPKDFVLHHQWYHNAYINPMAQGTLKYKRLDPQLRYTLRQKWNKPILWPVLVVVGLFVLALIPAIRTYLRKERLSARSRHQLKGAG
jgi:ABC-type transport system substrate-binding protein